MQLAFPTRLPSRALLAASAIALLLLAGCGEDGGTTTVEPPEPEFRLVSLESLAASTAFPLGPRLAINDAGQIAGSPGDQSGVPARPHPLT
ncbi:hypothetical protein BH23GEM4_BH23GEM4_09740 [soil metagenome]